MWAVWKHPCTLSHFSCNLDPFNKVLYGPLEVILPVLSSIRGCGENVSKPCSEMSLKSRGNSTCTVLYTVLYGPVLSPRGTCTASTRCCTVLYGPTKWGNPTVLPGPQWRPNGFSIRRTSSGVTSLVYKDWHINMICQKISVWQQQQHENFSNSSFLF